MSLDEAFRSMVRDELRAVVREEIRAALVEIRPSATPENAYLSVKKAAALAAVHPDTLRSWITAGRLPEHRAGRELRVRELDLHRFLDGGSGVQGRPTSEEVASAILSRKRLR